MLMAGLALAWPRAAHASEPAISAFDRAGRLTFQEVPTAASYQVEWTTNILSPTWSSNAPGLAAIPALGPGARTVTVGVVHTACFYRVVALMTNAPPTGLMNTFELTSENWLVVSYPFRSHVSNPATSSLPFDGTFGNPAGSVRVADVMPETGIAAPAPYLGNRLSFYGGSLAYDIYLRYTDNTTYPAVVLNGGTQSLYYDAPSPPLNAWEHKAIPLSEAGWKVSGGGTAATEAIFKQVLSNLVGLYIYTEWNTGPDDTNVDNISMTPL